MRQRNLLIFIAGFMLAAVGCSPLQRPATFPSLASSLRAVGPLDFCGEKVPLEIQEVQERLEKEILLSLGNRPEVILWLKRSGRYFPFIEKMLRENRLPDDLKYLAVAESALRPNASSGKGAVGFWQFMVHTGRRHKLVINESIDERRNIFFSTRAAIRYFKELHKKLGSWTLAAAAYNMGETGLGTEIREQETRDYYRLYLPIETQRFLFRILSVKLILLDPEKYGFRLNEEERYPPLMFDQVQVESQREVPVRIVAQAARTHFKVIKDLNPEIRGYYLPPGRRTILVPKGSAVDFQTRYERLERKSSESQAGRVYIVKEGDSLSIIADNFKVSLSHLIRWNRLNPRRPIYAGDRLMIYPKDMKTKSRVFERRKGKP